jgi:hypothetical protein
MTIATVKRPYELLVRWKDGFIAGAHVGFELTTSEDGVALSTTALPVMPVDIGQGVGFPLADILEQVQVDAITSRDSAEAKCAAAEADCAKHEAKIAELEAQIAKLESAHSA